MSKSVPAPGEFAKESNRYSGKGPGKLAFYCDACKRQCGDKLGYERHCNSKIHLEKVKWISENAELYLQENSDLFESQYLGCLKLRAGEPVEMNTLYQDLIGMREHTHMKGTRWNTLTEFIRYLDATHKCKVDFVDGKGWFLTYQEKDSGLIYKQQFANAKKTLISNAISIQSQHYYKSLEGNNDDNDDDDDGGNWDNDTTHKDSGQMASGIQLKIGHTTMYNPTFNKKNKAVSKSMFDDESDSDEEEKKPITTLPSTTPNQTTQSTNHSTQSNNNTTNNTSQTLDPMTLTQPQKRKLDNTSSENDTTTRIFSPSTQTPSNLPPQQFNPKWVEKEVPDSDQPWIRKGLIVKITNKKLEDGRYYGYKGTITNIFTSINRKRIPVDLTHKPKSVHECGDEKKKEEEDEDDEDDVLITLPDASQVCIDYSYTVVCEVTVMVDALNGDEKGVNGETRNRDGLVMKKVLLPQSDVQTTMPKDYELGDKNHQNQRIKQSKLLLTPSLTNEIQGSTPKRYIGCVNGVYCDTESDKIVIVKILELDLESYQAHVELIDPLFKTIQYRDDTLLQLSNWEQMVMVSLSAEDNVNQMDQINQIDPNLVKNNLYKSSIWLSYDDLCMVDFDLD